MADGVRVIFSGGPLDGLISTVPPAPLAYRHHFREDDEWWSVLYLHGPGERNGFPVMTAMTQPERVD